MLSALRSTFRVLWWDISSWQWWCLFHFWTFVDFVVDDYEEIKHKTLPRDPNFERDLLWAFRTEILKVLRPIITTRINTIVATVGVETSGAFPHYKLVIGCHCGLYSPTRGGEIAVIVLKGDKLELSYYKSVQVPRSRHAKFAPPKHERQRQEILFELSNPNCHADIAKIVWDIIKVPQ